MKNKKSIFLSVLSLLFVFILLGGTLGCRKKDEGETEVKGFRVDIKRDDAQGHLRPLANTFQMVVGVDYTLHIIPVWESHNGEKVSLSDEQISISYDDAFLELWNTGGSFYHLQGLQEGVIDFQITVTVEEKVFSYSGKLDLFTT